MTDELLPYYDRELAWLRRAGAEFARAHPKIAGRLQLDAEGIGDPHVERLIESLALLNARTRAKLEDDFPELTDALLETLVPHLLAPLPSVGLVRFDPAAGLTSSVRLERGAELQTSRRHGDPCTFRTCFDVDLVPARIADVSLDSAPFEAPSLAEGAGAGHVLKVVLERAQEAPPFAEILPERLRLHLAGSESQSLALLETLCCDVQAIAVAGSSKASQARALEPNSLQPVGFAADEAILPETSASHRAYRLLTEYFAYPSKFQFVDLHGLAGASAGVAGERLHLFFYLRPARDTRSRDRLAELEQQVDAGSLALGCTPIVNLFERRAEPMRLSHEQAEVRVVPDARRPATYEVYSVNEVALTRADGTRVPSRPFYGLDHSPDGSGLGKGGLFHRAVRRESSGSVAARAGAVKSGGLGGTEVFLQLVDLALDPKAPADTTLGVVATCTNRELPANLPAGDRLGLELQTGAGATSKVTLLGSVSPPRRLPRREGAHWRLVSHLSLQHLSVVGGESGAEVLREILRLYDPISDPATRGIVDSLERIESGPVALRVSKGAQSGLVRGTAVEIHLDERRFSGFGAYLFASVLEVFLGSVATLNSFVRITVHTNLRDVEVRRWAPRSGTGSLL